MLTTRRFLAAVAAAALVAGLAVGGTHDATAAPVGGHPDPGIVTPVPAPGALVDAGDLRLTAVLVAAAGVADAQVTMDGEEVPSWLGNPSGSSRTLNAAVRAEPGHRIARVEFRDGEGRTAVRAWRFTATDLEVRRLAGDDRIATAVALSQDAHPDSGSAAGAVLARADDFADALAGAPLAYALGGPLLLSGRDGLAPAAAAELERVLPAGSTVHLLGGTSALSAQVAEDVAALGFDVQRIAGADRYASATAVAAHLSDASAAFVASGETFADALAASGPAARDGLPILLTASDALPDATREYLAGAEFERVYVVGGPAAIDDAVVAEIRGVVGEATRIAGADRYATAAAVVDRFHAEAAVVAVASGVDFPDALAGGVHAAATGAALFLSPVSHLASPQVAQAEQFRPSEVVAYGGRAALRDTAVGDVRRAVVDRGGPEVTGVNPPQGAEVRSLDTLEVSFDRELELAHSSMYVTMDGREVYGRMTQGDFTDTLVFQLASLPFHPVPFQDHEVVVHALAYDGSAWRHVEYPVTYRKLDLSRGDAGEQVLAVQQRLTELGYWLGTPDGNYGSLTVQAVMALQKTHGLDRSGSVDQATRNLLEVAGRPQPRTTTGRAIEVDKTRQILMIVENGVARYTFNTSTGSDQPFTRDGQRYSAHTPEGTFTITRQIDGMRESALGLLWRPKYFTDRGHAVHGSTSVPDYPASAGCVRVTYPAMDFIWAENLMPIGTRILVYS